MSRRAATIAVGLAAFMGAGLAAGIMWYRMAVEELDYTRQSWMLIGPLWAAPLLAVWIGTRQPLARGITLTASSLVASWYFSDVFGFVPGAVIFGIGVETSLRAIFSRHVEAT